MRGGGCQVYGRSAVADGVGVADGVAVEEEGEEGVVAGGEEDREVVDQGSGAVNLPLLLLLLLTPSAPKPQPNPSLHNHKRKQRKRKRAKAKAKGHGGTPVSGQVSPPADSVLGSLTIVPTTTTTTTTTITAQGSERMGIEVSSREEDCLPDGRMIGGEG